jgi:TRAP-type C4-dicarboxylate transport system permease small subunit
MFGKPPLPQKSRRLMMQTIPTSQKIYSVLDRVSATMVMLAMVVSGSSVAAIIAINSVDTLGRAFFTKPLTGAVELTELFLAMCIILAIPYAQRMLSHIEIDMFIQKCSVGWKKFFVLISIVLTILVFFMLTIQSYESAKVSVVTFESSAGYLRVPVWIGKISVAIGFGIALFEASVQLLAWFLFGRLTTTKHTQVAH